MTAINLQMFGTPKAVYQSSNINQLTPDWVNIAYQVNDSLLAGNNVSSTYTNQPITVALNYGITGNQSAKHFANLKRGEFTPLSKGDFSHLSKEANYPHWQGLIWVTTQGRIEFFESIKKGSQSATLGNVDIKYRASENYQHSDHFVIGKGNNLELIQKCAIHHLRLWVIVGYSKNALAKSSVRIETLNQLTATHDAPSVFFCVYAYAYLQFAVLYRPNSMVMLAGQPKGWLESVNSSSLNPVSVTTPIEIETSGGDSLTKLTEIIVMMATPTQTQFKFLFLAVKRTDKTDTPHRIEATASNEHDARLMLVRDYILSFAGRLPAQEVAHA